MSNNFDEQLAREKNATDTVGLIKNAIKSVAENKKIEVLDTDTPLSVLGKIDEFDSLAKPVNFYGTWQADAGTRSINTNGGTSGVDYSKYNDSETYYTLINTNAIGIEAGGTPTNEKSVTVVVNVGGNNLTAFVTDQTDSYSYAPTVSYSLEGTLFNMYIFDNAEFDLSKVESGETAISALKYSVGKCAVMFSSSEETSFEITSIKQYGVELLKNVMTMVVKEDGTVDRYEYDENTTGISYSINDKVLTMTVDDTELNFTYSNDDNVETLTNSDTGISLIKQYYPTKTKTIIDNGTYSGIADGGYNEVVVDVPDMLQARVDATNSCFKLLYEFLGKNVDFLKRLDTSKVDSTAYMFYGCSYIKTILEFDTSNVTNMGYMFSNCNALTSIPLLDTSNVTTMISMFSNCYSLTNLPLLNTSKVTNMQSMLYYCEKLTEIPLIDTSKVTNLNGMFYYCKSLTTVPELDTSSAQDTSFMFFGCTSLTTIPLLSTARSSRMQSMFYGCTSLTTIPELNTSSCAYTNGMFRNCTNLTTIPQLKTSLVTDMSNMFNGCSKLTSIPELDTIKVTNMNYMFMSCYELISVPLLNMIKVTGAGQMFYDCKNLTNLTLKNIKVNLVIGSGTSYGHLLTVDSLINTVKELWDYSSGSTTYTLTMGTANTDKITDVYVKLITPTEEQIADDQYIESKMPCEVCESTDEGAMTLTAYANLKNWQIA